MGGFAGRVAIALGVLVAAAGCGSRTLPGVAEVAGEGGNGTGEGGSGGDGATRNDSGPTCTVHGGYCVTDAECCNREKCTGNSCGGMPVCRKDGQSCMRNRDCCMGQCAGGTCGGMPPPCQPDGTTCMVAAQCCSNQCNNNVCGNTSTCMAIGSAQCDVCTAQSCCPEVSACQQEAMCNAYLQCIAQCEQNGGTGVSCSQMQCAMLADALAAQLNQCAAQMCLMECTSS